MAKTMRREDVPRERGGGYRDDLTLERHHASTSADIHELRRAVIDLGDQVRKLHDRSEQVYSWLAQLRTDMQLAAKRNDLGAILEGQAAKRVLTGQAKATEADVDG